VIGPAVGAWVLRNAQQILNNDGTYSFLPNENIFLAAAVAAVAVIVLLGSVFRKQRGTQQKTLRAAQMRKTHRKK